MSFHANMQTHITVFALFLSAHDNSLTTYEVQYRGVNTPNDVDESFFQVVTIAPGMTLSVTISGLMAYSAYNVSVRATNQYGVGDFSEEVTVRTEEGGECALLYCKMTSITTYEYTALCSHGLLPMSPLSSICSPQCDTAWQYTHLSGNLLVHALFQ